MTYVNPLGTALKQAGGTVVSSTVGGAQSVPASAATASTPATIVWGGGGMVIPLWEIGAIAVGVAIIVLAVVIERGK